MKIHLSADYQSEIWFYPAYTMNGQLTAVELVSQFVHESAPITLPQDLLLPQLSDAQQLRLLQSQIALLEQNYAFLLNIMLKRRCASIIICRLPYLKVSF
ncbi:hypothetical protein O3W44_05035 [Pantoea sp. LMR881]|nr:hypothetical protein [Pantoea sp. LMR881]MCZ4058572.1 hypothetical protein [Pantoea sp. LMR881]